MKKAFHSDFFTTHNKREKELKKHLKRLHKQNQTPTKIQRGDYGRGFTGKKHLYYKIHYRNSKKTKKKSRKK